MSALHDILFSPLDKNYCDVFYYYMIFSFLLLVAGTLSLAVVLFKVGRKIKFEIFAVGIIELLLVTIVYLQQRVLYSMCIKS